MKPIKRAEILGQSDKKSAGSFIARAFVGGALLGPLGAAAGAVTAKNAKGYVDILVEYKDGTYKVITCHTTSTNFKECVPYFDK